MTKVEESVRHCLDRGLTFAAFRWNNELHLWIQRSPELKSLNTIELDGASAVFVIAPFIGPKGLFMVLDPDHRIKLDSDELDRGMLDECNGSLPFDRSETPRWAREDYVHAVQDALSAMEDGVLSKVVLSRCMDVPCTTVLLPELFVAGLAAYPSAFVCLVNSPSFGTWLGASPERLIEAENDRITIDALAGTMTTRQAPPFAADWGLKERDEQDQVTQSVLEVLRSIGNTSPEVEGPMIMGSGPITHLHTRIRAELSGTSLAEITERLHPTAAVCGRPTDPARDFIIRHEPHDRGLYSGYWGPWRGNGRTSLFANIRCVHFLNDRARIFSGGGITSGSDPLLEWEETELKARTWLDPIEALMHRVS